MSIELIPPISTEIFHLMRDDEKCIEKIVEFEYSDWELRPFFPTIIRLCLCPESFPGAFEESRRELLRVRLLPCTEVNSFIQLMSVDFQEIDSDIRKELVLKKKTLNVQGALGKEFRSQGASRFEIADANEKHRTVLSQVLTTSLLVSENKLQLIDGLVQFEPFDNEMFFQTSCDILSICLSEIPTLDITTLCHCLLFYEKGPEVIQRLIINSPHSWLKVLKFLMEEWVIVDEKQLKDTMVLLGDLSPNRWGEILNLMICARWQPGLFLVLGAEKLSAEKYMNMVSTMVQDQSLQSPLGDLTVSEWILNCIDYVQRSGQQQGYQDCVSVMKEKLCETVMALQRITDENRTEILSRNLILDCSLFIRLVTALKCLVSLRLTGDELSLVLSVITLRPPCSAVGVEALTMGFVSILAFPGFISAPGGGASPDAEQIFIEWVRWMVDEEEKFDEECGDSCYGELLLLAGMHFHTGQFSLLSQLMDPVLGFEVPIQPKMMQRLRTVFTLDLFPEQKLAERASKVAVTRDLSLHHKTYLPINCVLQLMKNRAFSKHKVIIKNWIVKQIKNCSTPVHPVVPELLETYVKSCICPLGKQISSFSDKTTVQITTLANPPLDEDFLMEEFSEDPLDESRTVSRILFLYYLLFFQETWLTEARKIAQTGRPLKNYSDELWSAIPIKFLLEKLEDNWRNFLPLYTSMLKLAATFFPYILRGRICDRDPAITRPKSPDFTEENFKEKFDSSHDEAMRMMKIVKKLRPRERIKYLDVLIESGFPTFLPPETPTLYILELVDAWNSLERLLPRRVYQKTVSVLHPGEHGNRCLSHKDLCEDPLEILRADKRIFRSPKLLELLLRILQFYLSAAKIQVEVEVTSSNLPPDALGNQAQEAVIAERGRLGLALINAQESAIVQMLLEICLPVGPEKEETGLTVLCEIRALICCFLHQLFIGDKGNILIKLVHFQGYQRELIPVAVRGIPSMHVCLDFIPELISQPDFNKRVFAIDLLGHLSQQFTIPKAFDCAKLTVDTLSTFLSDLPLDITLNLFSEVVPSVAMFLRLFPPLTSDIMSMLRQVRHICLSRLSMKSPGCAVGSANWKPNLDSGTGDKYSKSVPEENMVGAHSDCSSIEMRVLELLETIEFV